MQKEGNAVLYDGKRSPFTTPTAGHPGAWLSVSDDGRVTISSAAHKPLRTSEMR
jgi:hypothetical protein